MNALSDRTVYVVSCSQGYCAFGGVENRHDAILTAAQWICDRARCGGEATDFRVLECTLDENEDYDVTNATWSHEFSGVLSPDEIDDWMAASTEVTDMVRNTLNDGIKVELNRLSSDAEIRAAAKSLYEACASEQGNAVVILGGVYSVERWLRGKIEQIGYPSVTMHVNQQRSWCTFALGEVKMPEEEWVPTDKGSTVIYQDQNTGQWRNATGVFPTHVVNCVLDRLLFPTTE